MFLYFGLVGERGLEIPRKAFYCVSCFSVNLDFSHYSLPLRLPNSDLIQGIWRAFPPYIPQCPYVIAVQQCTESFGGYLTCCQVANGDIAVHKRTTAVVVGSTPRLCRQGSAAQGPIIRANKQKRLSIMYSIPNHRHSMNDQTDNDRCLQLYSSCCPSPQRRTSTIAPAKSSSD